MTLTEAMELLGEHWPRSGKLRCPAHPDKTPSLQLYPENDSFYCFSCARNGDVYGFIALMADIPIKEALRKYAGPQASKPKVARKVNEHEVRKELELRLITALDPMHQAVRNADLTEWQRDIIVAEANRHQKTYQEALKGATPYEAEMLLREIPRMTEGFIETWQLGT